MYAGRKVEEAPAAVLFDQPGHPYTEGLLGSIPHLDEVARNGARRGTQQKAPRPEANTLYRKRILSRVGGPQARVYVGLRLCRRA